MNTTQKIFSWTYREPIAGYCRAIRKGNHIFVSGTTASDGDRIIGVWDPEKQMRFIMQKIEQSIVSLGWNLDDVIKTIIFLKNTADCDAVVRVHGEIFKGREPSNTTVQANLIGEDYLVEVEAEAIILDIQKKSPKETSIV